eukprot:6151720-Amphidinium_carterae.1
MASYDWRLSFADLEKRDRYFTRQSVSRSEDLVTPRLNHARGNQEQNWPNSGASMERLLANLPKFCESIQKFEIGATVSGGADLRNAEVGTPEAVLVQACQPYLAALILNGTCGGAAR